MPATPGPRAVAPLVRPRPTRQPLVRPALRTRAARTRGIGAAAALLTLAAVSTAAAPGVLHVTRGDTLSGIAARFGTTVSALQAANHLGHSDRIYAGHTLVLQTAYTAAPSRVASSAAAAHRAQLAARPAPSRAAVQALVASTARRYGVDPSLAQAVAYQESGFQQRAVSGVDAVGVMQVLPSTGRVLSAQAGRPLDLLQTEDNVTAGVLLLRQLLHSEGSQSAALAGYYQGLGSLAAKGVLPQTTRYVQDIAALRARFGG